MALYLNPANENDLFEYGAVSWRMDVMTARALKSIISSAVWRAADRSAHETVIDDVMCPEMPIGVLDDKSHLLAKQSLEAMLNDDALLPAMRRMNRFSIGDLELQNGSFDNSWHHDGLCRKRGHAGEFFIICYFGEPTWNPAWGGQFEYGSRPLAGDWYTRIPQPDPLSVRCVDPAERTVVLGWNMNPRMIHRAAAMTERKNRITVLGAVNTTSMP